MLPSFKQLQNDTNRSAIHMFQHLLYLLHACMLHLGEAAASSSELAWQQARSNLLLRLQERILYADGAITRRHYCDSSATCHYQAQVSLALAYIAAWICMHNAALATAGAQQVAPAPAAMAAETTTQDGAKCCASECKEQTWYVPG
jgi:predicted nucleic acid-binding protein